MASFVGVGEGNTEVATDGVNVANGFKVGDTTKVLGMVVGTSIGRAVSVVAGVGVSHISTSKGFSATIAGTRTAACWVKCLTVAKPPMLPTVAISKIAAETAFCRAGTPVYL